MLNLILEYRDEAQSIFAWLVCLSALRWGGGPERAIAIVWLIVFKGMEFIYHAVWEVPFKLDQMDVFHALTELLVAGLFILIALNANRLYTLWIAAFQIIATSAHLVREFVEAVTPLVYAIMVVVPSYFQLLIFACGLILHAKRRRKYGVYRDWRNPSSMSLASIESRLGIGRFGGPAS